MQGNNSQPLFDVFKRTDAMPSTHQESSFKSLNIIAVDYWEHPRALMQQWLGRIPSEREHTTCGNGFDPARTNSSAARSLSSTCTKAFR